MVQLCAIPLYSIISYDGAEISTSLSILPAQEAAGSNKVTSQPSLLIIRQPKFPQPLLIGHALQPFYQFCCLPLDAFMYLNILFTLWSLGTNKIFKLKQHQH